MSMQDSGGMDKKTDKDKLPKHACKGQNDCKGQGRRRQEACWQERLQGQGRLRDRWFETTKG